MTPKRVLTAALICLVLVFAAGCSILSPEAVSYTHLTLPTN
jgi:hypothetical protein